MLLFFSYEKNFNSAAAVPNAEKPVQALTSTPAAGARINWDKMSDISDISTLSKGW